MLKWFKITLDKVKKFRAYILSYMSVLCWAQRSNLGTRIYSIHLCSAFGITKKGMRTRIIVQRCQKIFPMQRLLFVEICHTYKHRHVVHNIIVVDNRVMTFPKNEWDSIIWDFCCNFSMTSGGIGGTYKKNFSNFFTISLFFRENE